MVKKILVIEDEPQIRRLILGSIKEAYSSAINSGELTVFEATNGDEGLHTATLEKPDLIFLDIMLPIIDGYEVCRKIRETSEAKDAYIIMLTARQEAFKGMDAGANEYMTKPFEPEFIALKVRETLDIDRNG